jgi:putative DNA methylase
MSSRETYAKRLIEVDLPIKRISAHARREKSIRHGHISTLHIWWARRPLAACRAVICAALWPDPGDAKCPKAFIKVARQLMLTWVPHERQALLSEDSRKRFEKARKNPALFEDTEELRGALLDFIADFANWDNSTVREYLDTSRALTQAAHEALGGARGTRPLVVDPFAGGGSIPLEALRVGADAFASDLNPVPVLLNKVVLEYIPKYGQHLADEVRKWGEWIKHEAEKELAEFYPKDADGATPVAYLWARTIQCEGPGCGAEVPLIRSLWLAKKANRPVALQLVPNRKARHVDFQIMVKQRGNWVNQDDHTKKIADPKLDGTVKRGSTTCPCCGYTTPVTKVREQFKARNGGAHDARLFCVVTSHPEAQGRFYRAPTARDTAVARKAASELQRRSKIHKGPLSLTPDEHLPLMSGVFNVPLYGHNTWGSLFTPRQALTLTTLARLVSACAEKLGKSNNQPFSKAVKTCLALIVDRQANTLTSLSRWHLTGEKIEGVFSRQALGMVWDFAEANSFSGATGDLDGALEWVEKVCSTVAAGSLQQGHVERASATQHPLPNDSANAFVTDPPYYNAVPYADLSDFFYVWLRRTVGSDYPELFSDELSPKDDEACEMAGWDPVRYAHKNSQWFENQMKKAMAEGRRILAPDGIGIVVFAHKSTAGWEAQLQAMIDAGWVTTGSWPIDTEMGARLRAQDSAVLASSVHLVCRPRENPDGSVRTDEIGDWRDVLQELPRRIHEWMPRLADEGVVGADAIFACLGPALEVFSRYSRVEKASGENVSLKEYLEHVWAAVSKEALAMIFAGVDATGFEEDARLTAMWLWTLLSAASNGDGASTVESHGPGENEEDEGTNAKKVGGFVLEYDAARKIAQGLGAHLERLASLVEVKGPIARLLPVAERTRSLFQKGELAVLSGGGKAKRKSEQISLGFVAELERVAESDGWGEAGAPRVGETVLDRVHQSMILFGAGRGEALKRFLVDDGVGNDDRFWRLAQAFSSLYPSSTDEKRWVDGVLARKKGLGF